MSQDELEASEQLVMEKVEEAKGVLEYWMDILHDIWYTMDENKRMEEL